MLDISTSEPPIWDTFYAVLLLEIRSSTLDQSDLENSFIDHVKI